MVRKNVNMEARVADRPPRTRLRRAGRVIGWLVAAFAFVGGLASVWSMARFPAALAHDPVTAEARVTDSFINGFGGDPAVNYEYWVDGTQYVGWGTQDDRHRDLLSLQAGATVTIRYARATPSASCMCNPSAEKGDAVAYAVDAAFIAPLPILLFRTRQRRRRGRAAEPQLQ